MNRLLNAGGITLLVIAIPILIGFGLETGEWIAEKMITETPAQRAKVRYEECIFENVTAMLGRADAEVGCRGLLQ